MAQPWVGPRFRVQVLGFRVYGSFDLIVNASARPPRLVGLPTVGTCNYRYTGIQVRYIDTVICLLHTQ